MWNGVFDFNTVSLGMTKSERVTSSERLSEGGRSLRDRGGARGGVRRGVAFRIIVASPSLAFASRCDGEGGVLGAFCQRSLPEGVLSLVDRRALLRRPVLEQRVHVAARNGAGGYVLVARGSFVWLVSSVCVCVYAWVCTSLHSLVWQRYGHIALVVSLHARILRIVSESMRCHYEGLSQAARAHRHSFGEPVVKRPTRRPARYRSRSQRPRCIVLLFPAFFGVRSCRPREDALTALSRPRESAG